MVVVSGVVVLEIVLVEGKMIKGEVEARGNRVLGISCDVPLDDEDGEGVLFVVVASLPVVRAGVVFDVVAIVVLITGVVVVLVSFTGFVVFPCRTGVVPVVEAVVVMLSEVTCAVVWFTFSTGFAVVAFNIAALVRTSAPAVCTELLEGVKAGGKLDVIGRRGGWSVGTICVVNEKAVEEFFTS